MKIDKWTLSFVAFILIGGDCARAEDTSEDPPATHNMLVIGGKSVFLSHLPMFDELNEEKSDYISMHRYQVILEARFVRKGKDVTHIYTKDRESNAGIKIYTLRPARFTLAKLFTPNPEDPALRSFRAAIFRDHLERNGEMITGLEEIVVDVKRIVHARKFEPSQDKPPKLEYFLFGKGDELFLAHLISKPPDFDQILSVKTIDRRFTDEELRRGVRVLVQDRENTASQRIKENEQVQTQVQLANASQLVNVPVKAGAEYYFEEGELAMPAVFDQTSEEKKAGF
jgi:hypothetical protein